MTPERGIVNASISRRPAISSPALARISFQQPTSEFPIFQELARFGGVDPAPTNGQQASETESVANCRVAERRDDRRGTKIVASGHRGRSDQRRPHPPWVMMDALRTSRAACPARLHYVAGEPLLPVSQFLLPGNRRPTRLSPAPQEEWRTAA